MREYEHITPRQFLEKFDNGELKDDLVIDVREPFEWDYYHLEETTLMPLQTIPSEMAALPRDKTIYVVCAHGVRSVTACRYLAGNGFDRLVNVLGGMAAIASERGFAYD